jgi:hypothetical protein
MQTIMSVGLMELFFPGSGGRVRAMVGGAVTFVGQPFQADFACPNRIKLGKPVRLESLTYREAVELS